MVPEAHEDLLLFAVGREARLGQGRLDDGREVLFRVDVPDAGDGDEPREQAAREREHQQRERERIAEQRRLNQALLLRYPDRNAHEAARLQQAQQLDEVQAMARARLASLDELYLQAQKDLATQGSNPTPEAQRAVKAAQMAVAAQKQSIETNELNRQRTMLRFDAEGRRLEKLWAGEQP